MSKFNKGDIVDVPWGDESPHRGIIHVSWGRNISKKTGLPMVGIFLFDEGFVGHFDEDEVELALDEYEFVAVSVDQEDWEQTQLGDWGTFEGAQDDAVYAVAEGDDEEYKATHMIQINRRRKAGFTIGFQAYRW